MIRKIIVLMMISLSFTGMLYAGTVGAVKGIPQASLTLQNTSKLNVLAEILNESCISGNISPFADLHLRKP
jgi:hypothetical protein